MPLPFGIHAHQQSWYSSLTLTLILALLAFVYSRGWLLLRRASATSFPSWRLAAFVSGLLAIWIAVGSPLAVLDHELLTVHMLKHLLLMAVGAPLILLGAPALPLLCGLPKYFIRRSLLLRSRTPQLSEYVRNSYVFCWLAGTAAVIAWHFPRAFDLGMQSASWNALECASFLAAGILFWMPVIRPWPSIGRSPQWPIPLYLFLATLPCDALSAFLTFCGRVVYPHYVHMRPAFDISPLADQEFAGALMWVFVTFAYLVPAVAATIKILSPSRGHRQWEPWDDVGGGEAQPLPSASAETA
jgi:cytochrome c oxidase assembly factor CtaG